MKKKLSPKKLIEYCVQDDHIDQDHFEWFSDIGRGTIKAYSEQMALDFYIKYTFGEGYHRLRFTYISQKKIKEYLAGRNLEFSPKYRYYQWRDPDTKYLHTFRIIKA